MRISVILSTGIKGIKSMYWFHSMLSNFHLLSPSFVFDSFDFKHSLIVILTDFSHSSISSKLPARENLQFYSMTIIQALSQKMPFPTLLKPA